MSSVTLSLTCLSLQENGRTIAVLVAAKHNDLDLELVNTTPNSASPNAEYAKIHPLGKIPAFVGANGFTLTEVIAIAIYGMLMIAVFFELGRFRFSTPTPPPLRPSFFMMRYFKISSYPWQNYTVEINTL